MPLPDNLGCIFVEAPNLSIPIIKFMHMLRQHGAGFSGYDVSLTERHQHTKTSVAGTAVEIGRYLGVSPSEIQSIRDPGVQCDELGIQNTNLHACHILVISECDCTIRLQTKVEGHATYIEGLTEIVLNLHKLGKGHHKTADLVDANIL